MKGGGSPSCLYKARRLTIVCTVFACIYRRRSKFTSRRALSLAVCVLACLPPLECVSCCVVTACVSSRQTCAAPPQGPKGVAALCGLIQTKLGLSHGEECRRCRSETQRVNWDKCVWGDTHTPALCVLVHAFCSMCGC